MEALSRIYCQKKPGITRTGMVIASIVEMGNRGSSKSCSYGECYEGENGFLVRYRGWRDIVAQHSDEGVNTRKASERVHQSKKTSESQSFFPDLPGMKVKLSFFKRQKGFEMN